MVPCNVLETTRIILFNPNDNPLEQILSLFVAEASEAWRG
jgi:hypothetical protein